MIKLCGDAKMQYKKIIKAHGKKPSWVDGIRLQACEEVSKKINFKCRFDGGCYRSPLKKEEKKNDKKSKNV